MRAPNARWLLTHHGLAIPDEETGGPNSVPPDFYSGAASALAETGGVGSHASPGSTTKV